MNGEIVPMMAPMMVVQNQHIMQQNPTVHGAHYLPQVSFGYIFKGLSEWKFETGF